MSREGPGEDRGCEGEEDEERVPLLGLVAQRGAVVFPGKVRHLLERFWN